MRLSDLVTRYVTFKQTMGLTFDSQAGILQSFCRSIGDVNVMDIDLASVEAFLAGKGQVTTYWYLKFKVLSGFFRFLRAREHIGICPLPATIPKIPDRRPPHIYT